MDGCALGLSCGLHYNTKYTSNFEWTMVFLPRRIFRWPMKFAALEYANFVCFRISEFHGVSYVKERMR
jgi:hypothetical protein